MLLFLSFFSLMKKSHYLFSRYLILCISYSLTLNNKLLCCWKIYLLMQMKNKIQYIKILFNYKLSMLLAINTFAVMVFNVFKPLMNLYCVD